MTLPGLDVLMSPEAFRRVVALTRFNLGCAGLIASQLYKIKRIGAAR